MTIPELESALAEAMAAEDAALIKIRAAHRDFVDLENIVINLTIRLAAARAAQDTDP